MVVILYSSTENLSVGARVSQSSIDSQQYIISYSHVQQLEISSMANDHDIVIISVVHALCPIFSTGSPQLDLPRLFNQQGTEDVPN